MLALHLNHSNTNVTLQDSLAMIFLEQQCFYSRTKLKFVMSSSLLDMLALHFKSQLHNSNSSRFSGNDPSGIAMFLFQDKIKVRNVVISLDMLALHLNHSHTNVTFQDSLAMILLEQQCFYYRTKLKFVMSSSLLDMLVLHLNYNDLNLTL